MDPALGVLLLGVAATLLVVAGQGVRRVVALRDRTGGGRARQRRTAHKRP